MAGPLSPPRIICATVRRSSPALGFRSPWQAMQLAEMNGQMWRSNARVRAESWPRTDDPDKPAKKKAKTAVVLMKCEIRSFRWLARVIGAGLRRREPDV